MKPRSLHLHVLIAAACLLGCAAPALGDLIHLKSGVTREVDEVLYEKEGKLFYKSGENVIGMPLSVVARWERTEKKEEEIDYSSYFDEPIEGQKAKPENSTTSKPKATLKNSHFKAIFPKLKETPIVLGQGYSAIEVSEMERVYLRNPRNDSLRRRLAGAESQIAVEGFLASQMKSVFKNSAVEERYQRYLHKARGFAPEDILIQRIETIIEEIEDEEMSSAHERSGLAVQSTAFSGWSGDYRFLLLEGLTSYRANLFGDALRLWEEAREFYGGFIDLNAMIEKLKQEEAASAGFEQENASHFTFIFDGRVDSWAVEKISEMLENGYEAAVQELDYYPETPITCILYASGDFELATGVSSHIVAGLFDGKIRIPVRGILRLDARMQLILTHETVHAVIFHKTKGKASRWVHEGLAQTISEEEYTATDAATIWRTLKRNPHLKGPYNYPSALSWIRFLDTKYGSAFINDLLDEMSTGKSEDQAYEDVYGFNRADLFEPWIKQLEKDAERD